MKPILLLVLSLGGQNEPGPAAPWKGTFAEGFAEIERRSDAGKVDDALALADALLARASPGASKASWLRRLGLSAPPTGVEAAVSYARGVVLARAGRRPDADKAFTAAIALAGAGDLRLDAMYDLGASALMEAEELRARIPELSGGKTPPQAATIRPPVPPPGAPAPPRPDPIGIARQAYHLARERLVERLRADFRDADTQADVELAQKRLKELDEIEKKREEQKKEQEKQPPDQQPKKAPDDSKKDESKPDQKNPQDQKPDQPKEEPKPDEKKPEEQPAREPEKPGDQKKEDEKSQARPAELKEQLLTKEEVTRLLDVLRQREQEGKELSAQLRRARLVKVRRDW